MSAPEPPRQDGWYQFSDEHGGYWALWQGGAWQQSVRGDRPPPAAPTAGPAAFKAPANRSRRTGLIVAGVVTLVVLVLAGGGAALVSSGALEEDYSSSDRSGFIEGCLKDGRVSEKTCGCLFDYIRARVPYDEFAEADRTEDSKVSDRMKRATDRGATVCVRRNQ